MFGEKLTPAEWIKTIGAAILGLAGLLALIFGAAALEAIIHG